MKILLKCLLLVFSFQACSQELTEEELESRRIAETVVNKYLKDQVKGKSYIIFSSGDTQFVVLVNQADSYHEYYIDESNGANQVKYDTIIEADTNLFDRMFDEKAYRKDYTSFRSEFYKDGYETASGNITYFSLVTIDGSRLGESRLSVFVKPNPIDAEVYLYFVQRLLANAGRS